MDEMSGIKKKCTEIEKRAVFAVFLVDTICTLE